MRKILAFILSAVMLISLASCATAAPGGDAAAPSASGENTTSVSDAPNQSAEIEEIVFAFPATKVVDGIQSVEDEINKIIESRINVHVTFAPISIANYSEQVNLMMSGGEQVDILSIFINFAQLLSRNQFMPIDDLVDEYAPEVRTVVGENLLKGMAAGGKLYGIPTNNGKAAVLNILLRDDILKANNISTDRLKLAKDFSEYCENLDELSDIFAKLKEAEPDMVSLVPSNVGTLLFTNVPFVDDLGDYYGVLNDKDKDTMKVTNMYAYEEFATLLGYARDWYSKGYILQDAATTQEAPNSYVSSGRTMGYFVVGEEGQAEQITTATGQPMTSIKLLEAYIKTDAAVSLGFGIASTSKQPEAAMKFLNEMYINSDVVNLLSWGIEGTHYEVQDDGTIDFPAGVDANNTSYGLNMDWFFGNQFLTHIWGKGRDTSVYERLAYNNIHSKYSPVMGFMYDSTKVRNELTALQNVSSEFLPGLVTGTVDPTTELPKYLDALQKAGMDAIIAEKQSQLDAWIASTK